jgi:hypothetical protein
MCTALAVASVGREFGTDIQNYRAFFADPQSVMAVESMEPPYVLLGGFLERMGGNPLWAIDVVAFVSLGLVAMFAISEERSLASLVIVLGWLLCQQFWGTIRSGLGVALLLFLDRKYLKTGRFQWGALVAPLFHWSLLMHPIAFFLKFKARTAIVVSIAAFAAITAVGSIKDRFFDLIPGEWSLVANYAALQTGLTDTALARPAVSALVIHLIIVLALTRIVDDAELPRWLGPLTILYVSTCVFYDFEQVSGRVANVLVGFRILALIAIYRRAERLRVPSFVTRLGVLSYCVVVAAQYLVVAAEYF